MERKKAVGIASNSPKERRNFGSVQPVEHRGHVVSCESLIDPVNGKAGVIRELTGQRFGNFTG